MITSLLFCSLAACVCKIPLSGQRSLFMLLTLFIPQEVCVVPLFTA